MNINVLLLDIYSTFTTKKDFNLYPEALPPFGWMWRSTRLAWTLFLIVQKGSDSKSPKVGVYASWGTDSNFVVDVLGFETGLLG